MRRFLGPLLTVVLLAGCEGSEHEAAQPQETTQPPATTTTTTTTAPTTQPPDGYFDENRHCDRLSEMYMSQRYTAYGYYYIDDRWIRSEDLRVAFEVFDLMVAAFNGLLDTGYQLEERGCDVPAELSELSDDSIDLNFSTWTGVRQYDSSTLDHLLEGWGCDNKTTLVIESWERIQGWYQEQIDKMDNGISRDPEVPQWVLANYDDLLRQIDWLIKLDCEVPAAFALAEDPDSPFDFSTWQGIAGHSMAWRDLLLRLTS